MIIQNRKVRGALGRFKRAPVFNVHGGGSPPCVRKEEQRLESGGGSVSSRKNEMCRGKPGLLLELSEI